MTTTFGPIELFTVEFSGDRPDAGVLAVLRELSSADTVRLVDLVTVARRFDEQIVVTELSEAADGLELIGAGLVGQDDIDEAAFDLLPGRGVALAALEMRWAVALSGALASAGGTVSSVALIPAPVVNELVASHSLTKES